MDIGEEIEKSRVIIGDQIKTIVAAQKAMKEGLISVWDYEKSLTRPNIIIDTQRSRLLRFGLKIDIKCTDWNGGFDLIVQAI